LTVLWAGPTGAGEFIIAIRNWLRERSWPHVCHEQKRSRSVTCWTGTLLQIDCVDRAYLALSVPTLVAGGQVVSFLTAHDLLLLLI
jgi:hypothetical protein